MLAVLVEVTCRATPPAAATTKMSFRTVPFGDVVTVYAIWSEPSTGENVADHIDLNSPVTTTRRSPPPAWYGRPRSATKIPLTGEAAVGSTVRAYVTCRPSEDHEVPAMKP